MFTLIQKPETELEYDNKIIKLKLWFNNVLLAYELFADQDFNELEKTEILFDMLCESKHKFELEDKVKILEIIIKDIINNGKKNTNDKPSFNFKYDAEAIFSSFMQQYNINLFEQHNKLWWHEFIALFIGLDDNTLIKKIINIRVKPLPKPTKHNKEEILNLQKLKAHYSLANKMSEEELIKQEDKSKLQFFKTLENIANSNNEIIKK